MTKRIGKPTQVEYQTIITDAFQMLLDLIACMKLPLLEQLVQNWIHLNLVSMSIFKF
jgi:hypothetical protein